MLRAAAEQQRSRVSRPPKVRKSARTRLQLRMAHARLLQTTCTLYRTSGHSMTSFGEAGLTTTVAPAHSEGIYASIWALRTMLLRGTSESSEKEMMRMFNPSLFLLHGSDLSATFVKL